MGAFHAFRIRLRGYSFLHSCRARFRPVGSARRSGRAARQCLHARPDHRHRAGARRACDRLVHARCRGDHPVPAQQPGRRGEPDAGRLVIEQRRFAQRATDQRARLRSLSGAALDRRHPRLPACRRAARLRPLPHFRYRPGAGGQGLCLGARRTGSDGRRHQPRHPQAGQTDRSRSARHPQSRAQGGIHRLQSLRTARHQAGQVVRAGQLYPQFHRSLGSSRQLRTQRRIGRGRRPPRFLAHGRLARERQAGLHAQCHRRILDQLYPAGRVQERAAPCDRSRRLAAQLVVALLEHRQPLFPLDHRAGGPGDAQDPHLSQRVRQPAARLRRCQPDHPDQGTRLQQLLCRHRLGWIGAA